MACELGVSTFFDAIRTVVRRLFLLPPKNYAGGTSRPRLTRHNTAPSPVTDPPSYHQRVTDETALPVTLNLHCPGLRLNANVISLCIWMQSDNESWEEMMAKPQTARFKRRKSFSSWEGSRKQTTAADAIHAAGYPLQIHTVTTPDGYVMQMERIPRPGAS